MVELSAVAETLAALAAEVVGAAVRVDVSYTVTAASGTLAEAVAESPELALAEFLVNVFEERAQTTDDRPQTAVEVARPAGPGPVSAASDGSKQTRDGGGWRVASPEHVAAMRWMTGQTNKEIAEALGLPVSTVAYHMGKIRKAARATDGATDKRMMDGADGLGEALGGGTAEPAGPFPGGSERGNGQRG